MMRCRFDTLYEKSSTGKFKHWTIAVEARPAGPTIVVRYGAGDSKVRVSEKTITKGKNIGKSNESTPYEQACMEAEATWKKKKDEGYVDDMSNVEDEVLLPMLAHTYQKRGHDIKFPCFVQPKLDGVRCLAKKTDDKTIKYYSRMGKEFTTLAHLTPELLKYMKVGQVFDGEIYSRDHTFQEMIRLVKKLRPESSKLMYYVFDMVDLYSTFIDRSALLHRMIPERSQLIDALETESVVDEDELKNRHDKYVLSGYEGLIVRNMCGMYKLKERSKDLQKYKQFQDAEFKIIGGVESTGVEAGCIIFTVEDTKGRTFAVRPRGSFEQRKVWMGQLLSLIGKKLTVRFQEYTDDGIPRFPVGIGIRDYE